MVGAKISTADCYELETPFLPEEIKLAVGNCGIDKCPGPDGFNIKFLQSFWEVVEADFVNFFSEFHEKSKLVRSLNSSFITLIPKKVNPVAIGEFRPISLIGCVYKVLANVLATRMEKVVHKVISLTQSAFIRDRNILDGVVVANEIVDEAKKKKKSMFIFKIDFEKVYDSVNWDFLVDMMEVLGFGDKWRGWIKECISSAEVSVLVNGSPTSSVKLGRGLRQGDPLSPFLYLMVAECLSRIMVKACSSGIFSPVKVGLDEVEVSHQYADDSIIFGEARIENILVLKSVLRCFEWYSGLKINFRKSYLMGFGVEGREIVGLKFSIVRWVICRLSIWASQLEPNQVIKRCGIRW